MDIEVDLKLFVTCRLCVQEKGQYQITPNVQEKIKYCFDIQVQLYDGLPQLICSACKNILLYVQSLKESFSRKQEDLKNRVLNKEYEEDQKEPPVDPILPSANLQDPLYLPSSSLLPQQNTVSSSQQFTDCHEKTDITISRKQRLSAEDSDVSYSRHRLPKRKKIGNTPKSKKWEAKYNKQLVCKICNSCWSTKLSIMNHIRSHNFYTSSYSHIFKKDCFVGLPKIDNKPNLTGKTNKVVHNANKVVQKGSPWYYIVYSKDSIDNGLANDDQNDSSANIKPSRYSKRIQSSSEDDNIILSKPLTARKRRILSRSSNETVVLEGKVPKNENVTPRTSHTETSLEGNSQCINIDSSDSENQQNLDTNSQTKQQIEANVNDYKLIQGIISMCVKFHQDKIDPSPAVQIKKTEKLHESTESQLKHKLLSIGRKIINKQGFNCTGLLRYMEHKNLEIIWMTKPDLQTNKENNYIRIFPKLRGHHAADDSKSWLYVSEVQHAPIVPLQVPIIPTNSNNEINQEMLVDNKPNTKEDSAVLYCTGSHSDYKNKLLNANPVANPKQLPKKTFKNQFQDNNMQLFQDIEGDNIIQEEDNLCMPIIASTTSLANVGNVDAITEDNIVSIESNSNTESQGPRIKVKPVTELMTHKALFNLMSEQSKEVSPTTSNMQQVQTIWPAQNAMNVYVTVPLVGQVLTNSTDVSQMVPQYQVAQGTSSHTSETSKKEHIILTTIELPNTKTDSPFDYVRNLLQIHNIYLLNQSQPLPLQFVCLIKFKVSFNQERPITNQPVVLCLSLFGLKNAFCFNVRDKNQGIIDIDKISANWQWEILQMYRKEDVVGKVLKTAEKVDKETHNFTCTMLCLLKTIDKVTVTTDR